MIARHVDCNGPTVWTVLDERNGHTEVLGMFYKLQNARDSVAEVLRNLPESTEKRDLRHYLVFQEIPVRKLLAINL